MKNFLVENLLNIISSISEEMSEVLIRSSYSTNIKERKDCSTAILNYDGLVLFQAEHIPIHLGSFLEIVKYIKLFYKVTEIKKNDIFICNDVYKGGGSHLPDITILSPVFYNNILINWIGNIAHHSDFVNRCHENIYQEGIRIPPTKLINNNKINKDLLRLILNNCQLPLEREIDLKAQISCNKVGLQRMNELLNKYDIKTLKYGYKKILDYSEERMKSNITSLPNGIYTFEELFDSTEIDYLLKLKVTIKVNDNSLIIDFSEIDAQLENGLNVTYSALCSTTYFAIKSLLDPYGPSNYGFFKPIKIKAKKGSFLNCTEPSAVDGRVDMCQRLVDLLFGCFSKINPTKTIAASNGSCNSIIFSGYDSKKNKYFIYLETIGGGSGARPNKDGLDGIHVHITNTSNLPIECLETEYPLKVLCYELIDDSFGKGKYRGGKGIRRSIESNIDNCIFESHGSRITIKPWGLFGGSSGNCYKLKTNINIKNKRGKFKLMNRDHVTIETAGGGGYGISL